MCLSGFSNMVMISATICAILLLGLAAVLDVAFRQVPDALSAAVFAIGLGLRAYDGTWGLALLAVLVTFVLLFGIFVAGLMAGGDVKLWAACTLLLPPGISDLGFAMRISILGGLLALIYLVLRRVIKVPAAGRRKYFLARMMRVEAWRITRPKIPLPYAVAISSAAISFILPSPL